jgi:outer membrane autotransporter protein
LVGVALAGAPTNWGLPNGLGGGNSDAFQAGVYGMWRNAGAYLSGAAAFANHWMSTDRVAFASDSLTAKFNAKVYGGRIEAGYRVAVMPLTGVAPYAAVQSQVYRTPDYIETDVSGGGFGLAFAARSVTDTRVEVGARFDDRTNVGSGMDVLFRSRIAWAHDWISDNTLMATFQSLPGASFIVNGAAAPKNLLLADTAAEWRLTPATSVTVKLDTELGSGSRTYAGTTTLRYRW